MWNRNLNKLIKAYAPHKLLKVTFGGNGVRSEEIGKFGEIEEFNPYACTARVGRAETKNTAIALLSSRLPVVDIVIDEVDVNDVIRQIFNS